LYFHLRPHGTILDLTASAQKQRVDLFAVGLDIAEVSPEVNLHTTCMETVSLDFDKYITEVDF
jgi:hypothetical protein